MAKATMSIDWEDFGQLYSKYHYRKFTEPAGGAIERQTNIILDLLDETDTRATFFILGKLAEYRPALVKQIAARNHEIALHGQNHEAMFSLTPAQAKEDIATSYKIVTNLTGAPVYGYRAPFFSIKKENIYLLETLADIGLLYDSSIFPVALPRYGIDGFSGEDKMYQLPNGKLIAELPMTTGKFMNKEWPVSGGGYIRLLPKMMIKKIFRNFSKNEKDSMIYMHPYEFDTQPLNSASNYPADAQHSKLKTAALNFRWNLFRPSITGKLRMLLMEHQFMTCLEKAVFLRDHSDAEPLSLS